MDSTRFDISGAMIRVEGLPRLQWDLVEAWIGAGAEPADQTDAWTQAARQWLEELGTALGTDYATDESENFVVLLPSKQVNADTLLRMAEDCRHSLLTALSGVAEFQAPGKQMVVVIRGSETYYTYLSAFYPDGRFGASGGIHIRERYPHIVVGHTQVDELELILGHEMTHAALQHLSLPQWIEEGLAQIFECGVSSVRQPLLVTPEIARRHKRYWALQGLDDFWRGDGFHRPGKVQGLSYQLAEILLRLLIADYRPRWFGLNKEPQRHLMEFLRTAKVDDCGNSAAQQHLGIDLSGIAGKFLGPGEWQPSL